MSPDYVDWPLLSVYSNTRGKQRRSVEQLIYLESELNYTWLYWTTGERLLVPYTLKRIATKLPPVHFIRIHRHYMVNLAFVDRVCLQPDQAQIYLVTGGSLPVARRRRNQIRQQWVSLQNRAYFLTTGQKIQKSVKHSRE